MANNNPGVRIQNITNNSAELLIFEEIDPFWGIGAKELIEQLNGLAVNTINVRINSPGGLVFDGFAIYNALVKHPARVEVDIEGLAASIASVIAMAGDEIRMAENALLMIHDPHSALWGTAEVFRKHADLLDQVAASIQRAYVEKTGLSVEEVATYMKDETWFDSELAVELGFVDSVTTRLPVAAKFEPQRLKNFVNTPEGYLLPNRECKINGLQFKNRLRLMKLSTV